MLAFTILIKKLSESKFVVALNSKAKAGNSLEPVDVSRHLVDGTYIKAILPHSEVS